MAERIERCAGDGLFQERFGPLELTAPLVQGCHLRHRRAPSRADSQGVLKGLPLAGVVAARLVHVSQIQPDLR